MYEHNGILNLTNNSLVMETIHLGIEHFIDLDRYPIRQLDNQGRFAIGQTMSHDTVRELDLCTTWVYSSRGA